MLRRHAITTLQEHIDPQNGIWADAIEGTQAELDLGLDLDNLDNMPGKTRGTSDVSEANAIGAQNNPPDSTTDTVRHRPNTSSKPPPPSTPTVPVAADASKKRKHARQPLSFLQRLRRKSSSAAVKFGVLFLVCIAVTVVTVQIEFANFTSRRGTSVEVFLAAERHYHLRYVLLSLVNAGVIATTPSEMNFWRERASSSLHFLADVQQALLFGGQFRPSDYFAEYSNVGTFNLEGSANRFSARQKLMFEDACELLEDASKRSMCESAYNGLFRKGMQNAITEFAARSHSALRLAEEQPWPRTPESISAFMESDDIRFLNDVLPNTLRHLSDLASEMYMRELHIRFEDFDKLGDYTLDVSFMFSLVVGVIIGANVVTQLNQSIKRNRTLLLNLPSDAFTEEVEDFILKHGSTL